MVIYTVSSTGVTNKLGLDGNPRSKERWTFIVGRDRLSRNSQEEVLVVDLLAAWVCTNVPPEIAKDVSTGHYADAAERILDDLESNETNSLCRRVLDILNLIAREQKQARARPPKPSSEE